MTAPVAPLLNVKVVAVIVEAFIDSLNVAVMAVLVATLDRPLDGVVEETVGAVASVVVPETGLDAAEQLPAASQAETVY